MHTATATDWTPQTLPALISNGVIGLRVPHLALQGGWCTVVGHVGRRTPRHTQGWSRAPYPLQLDFEVQGLRLSRQQGEAALIDQRYDFSCGELTTRFCWTVGGVKLNFDVLCFASRTQPHVVVQQVLVRSDRAVALTLTCAPGREFEGQVVFEDHGTGALRAFETVLLVESPGALSKLGVAVLTRLSRESQLQQPEHVIRLTGADELRIEQVAALVPSLVHREPDRQAMRLAGHALTCGVDRVRDDNRRAWERCWLARPVIEGPAQAQRAADAAFFHLHTNLHPSMPASSGLFGPGLWPTYHMFHGHGFWDIETFALPAVNLTCPASASRVLSLRREHLAAAQANARMNGYAGAQYPWESGTHGEEVTPMGWPKVFVEHHISLDVANAMLAHVWSTGDPIFAREVAWPVVRDVAEWICSRVVSTPRGYEILDVTGIDEGRPHVDNNSWTNGSAIAALQGAEQLAKLLGVHSSNRWAEVADSMFLPIRNGVLLKHDGQTDEAGLCPDPLALVFPLQWPMDRKLERRTIRYFLERREGYIGYPMLSVPMFVWAARLKERKLAAELFQRGVSDFLFGPFDQIDEFGFSFTEGKKPKVGPYLAHCGAIISALLLGLPRVRPSMDGPATWTGPAATLPEGWQSISVRRLWVRGQAMSLTVREGEAARLSAADDRAAQPEAAATASTTD